MDRVHPDVVAVAQAFQNEHGADALELTREIARNHLREGTDDAAFWSKVADVVEGLIRRNELSGRCSSAARSSGLD